MATITQVVSAAPTSALSTAIAETAYWSLRFFGRSPGFTPPTTTVEYTSFHVRVATDRALDLTQKPFAEREADWTAPDDYTACQALATEARFAGTALIRTLSARAAWRNCNIVVFDPQVFENAEPVIHRTWHFRHQGKRLSVLGAFPSLERHEFSAGQFGASFEQTCRPMGVARAALQAKNNHQVTRSLLQFWQVNRGINSVIWAYNVNKQERKFFQGANASFAIFEYLYAPLQEDGTRDDQLENDFAVDEGSLALLVQAANGKRKKALSYRAYKRAIKSCVSLGFRSAYYTANAMSLIKQRGKDDESLHRGAIEMMKRTLQTKYKQFENWRFVIITDLKDDLLVNEQPFRDWTVHKNPANFVTMALGPRAMLFGAPAPDGRFAVAWGNADQAAVNVANHNQFTIETTRDFIVAASEGQLDAIIPCLTPELAFLGPKLSKRVSFRNWAGGQATSRFANGGFRKKQALVLLPLNGVCWSLSAAWRELCVAVDDRLSKATPFVDRKDRVPTRGVAYLGHRDFRRQFEP
eukprot:gene18673-18972_t